MSFIKADKMEMILTRSNWPRSAPAKATLRGTTLDHIAYQESLSMTTIAFDGKILAADTRITADGRPERGTKLFRLEFRGERVVYAGCGDMGEMYLIAEWLAARGTPDDRPALDEPGCSGLLLNMETKTLYSVIGRRPVLCPVLEPFMSVGSGAPYALAAMALGKNAKEAIELAARFDVSTGGEIECVYL
jgi:hypothetical protein